MIRGTIAICKDRKQKKALFVKNLCRKCYDTKHKDRILKTHREWDRRNTHKKKQSSNNFHFGGNRDLVLERDNWECQECGMSQEKCIILFNRQLSVHHKDENGLNVPKEEKNNDIDNLITMCTRCHNLLHRRINKERVFGNLLEQDDSEWKYPKIREALNNKKKRLGTITEAKEELGEELGVSYHGIDHMCYQKKTTSNTGNSSTAQQNKEKTKTLDLHEKSTAQQ